MQWLCWCQITLAISRSAIRIARLSPDQLIGAFEYDVPHCHPGEAAPVGFVALQEPVVVLE